MFAREGRLQLLVAIVLYLCVAEIFALGLLDSPTKAPLVESCPQWFVNYEQFHRDRRSQPGSKYLIHEASTRLSGGLGDRLRGLVFTLRLASALQRVLLASWQHPADITEFLSPPGDINWSKDGIEINTDQAGRSLDIRGILHPKQQVQRLFDAPDTFIIITTNAYMDSECAGCPKLDAWSSEAVCIFQRLFQPRDVMQRAAEQQLRHLYGVSNPRYTAVHIRLGHLHGEQIDIDPTGAAVGPLRAFLAGMVCARQLAAMHGLNTTRTPVLLVTDHHHVRSFVQHGHFHNVVTPSGDAAFHLENAPNASIVAHHQTFVELIMLGQSECMVTSMSGFSHVAWLLGGGKQCREQVKSCI